MNYKTFKDIKTKPILDFSEMKEQFLSDTKHHNVTTISFNCKGKFKIRIFTKRELSVENFKRIVYESINSKRNKVKPFQLKIIVLKTVSEVELIEPIVINLVSEIKPPKTLREVDSIQINSSIKKWLIGGVLKPLKPELDSISVSSEMVNSIKEVDKYSKNFKIDANLKIMILEEFLNYWDNIDYYKLINYPMIKTKNVDLVVSVAEKIEYTSLEAASEHIKTSFSTNITSDKGDVDTYTYKNENNNNNNNNNNYNIKLGDSLNWVDKLKLFINHYKIKWKSKNNKILNVEAISKLKLTLSIFDNSMSVLRSVFMVSSWFSSIYKISVPKNLSEILNF